MRYNERFLVDKKNPCHIKDKDATDSFTPCRELSSKEYAVAMPNRIPRTLHFIFKGNCALRVDKAVAKALSEKFQAIYLVDGKTGKPVKLEDDLDKLNNKELMPLLKQYKLAAKDMGIEDLPTYEGTDIELRDKIRSLRKQGVELPKPKTDEDIHDELMAKIEEKKSAIETAEDVETAESLMDDINELCKTLPESEGEKVLDDSMSIFAEKFDTSNGSE